MAQQGAVGRAFRRPTLRAPVVALGAGMLLGLALAAPSAAGSLAGSQAPAPSTVPTAVPVAQVRADTAALAAPRMLMDEHFVHTWPDNPQGAAWFDTHGYRISARIPGEFVAIRAPLAEVPADVLVGATFRKLGGPSGGGYGLILRDQGTGAGDGIDQNGQYVVAEVGDRGQVGIWQRDVDRWVEIMPWTDSSAVLDDGRPNDVSAHVLGDRLTLAVNGTPVADVTVGLRPGGVGIFVGGDLNDVLVDRFRVQAPGHPQELTAVDTQPAAGSVPVAATSPSAPAPKVASADPRSPLASVPRIEPAVVEAQRVRDLTAGLTQDVTSLLSSFSDGFDGPHSPVNDPVALKQAAARLDTATRDADELLAELQSIHTGDAGGR